MWSKLKSSSFENTSQKSFYPATRWVIVIPLVRRRRRTSPVLATAPTWSHRLKSKYLYKYSTSPVIFVYKRWSAEYGNDLIRLYFQLSTVIKNGHQLATYFSRFNLFSIHHNALKSVNFRFSRSVSRSALSVFMCDWIRGYGGHLDLCVW